MTPRQVGPLKDDRRGALEADWLESGRRALGAGDASAARRAFVTAAEAGCVDAALPAAVMLLRGEGGEADPDEGLRWLRIAATHAVPGAALLLGRLRLATVGAAAEGVKWLRVAAEAGEAETVELLELAAKHRAKSDPHFSTLLVAKNRGES